MVYQPHSYMGHQPCAYDVLLVFDGADNPVFVAVGRAGGYSIFNYGDMAYIGYLASNGKGGYNWFSTNGEWLYYVVKK